MKERLVEVPPGIEEKELEVFPGSYLQMIQHNRLIGRLEELRTRLEKSRGEELIENQASIKEIRWQLGVLHEKDNNNVRKMYYG